LSLTQGLFNMTSDSQLFRTADELVADGWVLVGNTWVRRNEVMLPLYEAKMVHHYDHRWASYTLDGATRDLNRDEKRDPDAVVLPRYWVVSGDVSDHVPDRWERAWFLGWRDIARTTDERTVIAAVLPQAAVGHTMPLVATLADEADVSLLLSCLTSLAFDYIARQKMGGTHLTYSYLLQLPVPIPQVAVQDITWLGVALREWLADRVLELAYTSWDMEAFALDLYDDGPPYVWDDERRVLLRAELDATYFHLYGLDRDEVDHVLDTFPIVRRKDEARFGEFRTKRLILEVYDAMAKAIATGEAYQTILDPVPGQGPRHPDRVRD
jgi:hypothetical protein